jgi:hypothetical protein
VFIVVFARNTAQQEEPQVKKSSRIRASHVNTGTSIDREELSSSGGGCREFRHPKLEVSTEATDSTPYGGLSLAARLVSRVRLPQAIDGALSLLRAHRPFTEADHVLTHAYNLYIGGTCIEDIAHLQTSEPVRRLLGAGRIPDPTTAGDFLRRFGAEDLRALDTAIDEAQVRAWKLAHGKRKRAVALVDMDSHVHAVYGHQKEGTDFTYKGTFGYHPLAITLAGTQECLRLVNRPGNVTSADGAAGLLHDVFPMLKKHFQRVVVRGDSAFARQEIYEACEAHGQDFAIVSPAHRNFDEIAESLPEKSWKRFRADSGCRARRTPTRRKRGRNVRRRTARARGKRDLKLERQWLAEVEYRPARSQRSYRLVIRRQRIEESNQGELFETWRYRFVISNMSKRHSAEDVVKLTYQRCDQENIIEQLQNGVAAMAMPTGGFLANGAYLICARVAHNLKSWLAQIALPKESVRWEWKRFRQSFVIIAARVVRHAGGVMVRIARSHRFADAICRGIVRLQT